MHCPVCTHRWLEKSIAMYFTVFLYSCFPRGSHLEVGYEQGTNVSIDWVFKL